MEEWKEGVGRRRRNIFDPPSYGTNIMAGILCGLYMGTCMELQQVEDTSAYDTLPYL